jgi:hypothetical protein
MFSFVQDVALDGLGMVFLRLIGLAELSAQLRRLQCALHRWFYKAELGTPDLRRPARPMFFPKTSKKVIS